MLASEGQRLGNYRLHRLLGKGGFAEVYLAEHLYLNTSAAIKVLQATLDEEEERLFLTEAQTIARLAHPNIVRVRDFAIERSVPFLVMDYVPGGTLRQHCPRGTCLSLEHTVRHIKQIAAALQYAHNHGIIYRDVKPENVLQGAGSVLLSDFGISVSAPPPGAASSLGLAGTLPYMAPEQFQGQAVFASDQYALAIVAYEWLCGARPFEGSGMALASQHAHLPPPPLREKDPSLPEAVEAVILKALSKRPEQRYVSILTFARALERASRGERGSTIRAEAETEDADGAPPTLARRVFLSHAAQDDLTRLRTDLTLRDFTVQDEASTEAQEEQTRQAIRAAQVVLLFLTPHTRASAAVQEHLRLAQLYRRRIMCLWAQGEALHDLLPAGAEQATILDARGPRYTQALDEIVLMLKREQRGAPVVDQPFPDLDFEPRNPYKGLHAFTREDRADFFGRHTLVQELLARLREQISSPPASSEASVARFMAIVGPSGSGKSSVVMAGLLPALQEGALPGSEQWIYLNPLVPDKDPLSALAHLLAPYFPEKDRQAIREVLMREGGFGLHQLGLNLMSQPETRVVVTIDQFEELFSSDIAEPERRHFIEVLVTATTEPRGPVLVLLTLRADFYDRPFAYPALGRLIQQQQCAVLPMSLDELCEVIERPALLPDVRLTFDEDLVGDLLFDMRGQPGALPLLSFALEQLFHHRRDHRLTRYAYQEIGGVRGALSQHAEATYAALPSEAHRRRARTLFLRLVQPGGRGQNPLLRRADASEFVLEGTEQTQMLRQVIDAFTTARLLTSARVMGTSALEISHEALLREWPRLALWVREAREDMQLQQAISHDVREWERRGKPKDRLYRGSQLKESLAWQERNTASGAEAAFLRASATRRTRTRINLFLASLLLLAVLVPAGVLVVQQFTPLTVTTLKDDVPGSLRQAVENARAGGTILMAPSLKGVMFLNRPLLINKNLTIRGENVNQIVLRGKRDLNMLIEVQAHATITLSKVTFSDPTPAPGTFIFNQGTLTVSDCHLTGNVGTGVNSAAGNVDGGGAIENEGMLTLQNSLVANNTVTAAGESWGGGIANAGTLIVQNSMIAHNTVISSGGQGEGGGIRNDHGVLIVRNSQIVDNTVISRSQFAVGGGIFSDSGQVTLMNSVIAGNRTVSTSLLIGGGGGIFSIGSRLTISQSTINDNRVETNEGKAYGGGGGIMNLGSILSINDSHLLDNTVTSNTVISNAVVAGGAIFSLDEFSSGKVIATSSVAITNSVLSNNTVIANTLAAGGGIAATSGSLTLSGTTVENNRLTSHQQSAYGGGIYNGEVLTMTGSLVSGNSISATADQYARGGGIYTVGILTLLRSTIALNIVSSQGEAAGGGIFADLAASVNAHISLMNCTIADNRAQGSQGIGGGFTTVRAPIRTSIDFCTIEGNVASTRAGGIDGDPATTPTTDLLVLKNSIVAGNSAPTAPDIENAFLTDGYNLVQRWSGALVNDVLGLHRTDLSVPSFAQVGIATQLRMNGGPTPTLALQAGSPAIHAIPAAACDVATDQRGVKRPRQGACDIGAYEYS
jgi:hypothetical protein